MFQNYSHRVNSVNEKGRMFIGKRSLVKLTQGVSEELS